MGAAVGSGVGCSWQWGIGGGGMHALMEWWGEGGRVGPCRAGSRRRPPPPPLTRWGHRVRRALAVCLRDRGGVCWRGGGEEGWALPVFAWGGGSCQELMGTTEFCSLGLPARGGRHEGVAMAMTRALTGGEGGEGVAAVRGRVAACAPRRVHLAGARQQWQAMFPLFSLRRARPDLCM